MDTLFFGILLSLLCCLLSNGYPSFFSAILQIYLLLTVTHQIFCIRYLSIVFLSSIHMSKCYEISK